jgi:hypothetical protein
MPLIGRVVRARPRVGTVERHDALAGVEHVDRRVVTESHEGDRILTLPSEVEAIQDAEGPIPSPKRPNAID